MTTPLPVLPQLIVEAGLVADSPSQGGTTLFLDSATNGKLDTNTLGTAITWTDISQWVLSFTITRPSTRQQGPLFTYQAATCSVTLDNSGGRFDYDNTAGPYFGFLIPMAPLRVRGVFQSVTYPLFSGFADGWLPAQVTYEGGYTELTVPATDAFKIMAGITLAALGSPEGGGADTGARVKDILTRAGWYTSGDRSHVDVGNSTLQGTTLGDTALNLMQIAVDSEIGQLYVGGSGAITFRARHALLTDTRSNTQQAVFGDLPGTVVPAVCTSSALNANPGFDGNITGWSPFNGATIAYSTAYQYGPLAGVLSLHGDGVTSSPQAVSASAPVTATAQYTAFAVTYTPVAAQAQVNVNWFTSGLAYISTTTGPTVTSGTAWQVLSVTDIAPGTAAFAQILIQLTGTPASPVFMYAGYSSIIAGPASAAASELAIAALSRAQDDTTIANDIQATSINGGTLQEVEDVPSVAKYLFPRTYARSDLLLQDDPTTKTWAQWVLYVAKGAEDRFETLAVDPAADPYNLWPQALGREIGDRVQAWARPAGVATPIARDCFISGITHTWDSPSSAWLTTWTLQDASKYGSFFTLDNATLGKLDNNALAF